MTELTYVEAVVVGAFQGVTELFPCVKSWACGAGAGTGRRAVGRRPKRVRAEVGVPRVHRRAARGDRRRTTGVLLAGLAADPDGIRTSLRYRRIQTPAERLAWLIIVGTVPVGLAGLALDHVFRTTLGRPIPAAAFLMVNGVVLFAGERLRRRAPALVGVAGTAAEPQAIDEGPGEIHQSDLRLAQMPMARGVLIGSAQILALLPGISRSGITMAAGLLRGLNHDDAARFSFLLATPIILAAGVFKIPDLFGPLGRGHRRPGDRRQHRILCHRVLRGAVFDPLLPHPHPHAVRRLLHRRRRGRLLWLTLR